MTQPNFTIVRPSESRHVADCYQCRQSFDFLQAAFCECLTRERTFLCLSCGGCACEASAAARNQFWSSAPAELWTRRRREQIAGPARLQSLDPDSVSRPLAVIADDDPIVLAVAGRALRGMGFTTMMTTSAEEAGALANTMVPELLLTDALMPGTDGRHLCLKLKGDVRTRNIKVIVMSALYRGTKYRNEAFYEFLVDEYLPKPLKPEVLKEAVDRLLPGIARTQSHPDEIRVAS
ncbi:MAG: hypothetical protein QOK37_3974 [Thermoanaerobaculia bacterium]|jgi:CheY-like chemotaxis protein|nr:hypothetical protein [Thermoanaerobaculia bacterium]